MQLNSTPWNTVTQIQKEQVEDKTQELTTQVLLKDHRASTLKNHQFNVQC